MAGMGDRKNVPQSVIQEEMDKILNHPSMKEDFGKLVKEMAEKKMGSELKHCIDLLVDAGADLTILTPTGLSALGVYFEQRKSTLQWCKTMTSRIYWNDEEEVARPIADDYINKLLTFPGKVPTEVDQKYINYDPFYVDSDDIEDDDDDDLDDY